jgi:hypothetical protein
MEITFDLLLGGGAGADLIEEVVLSAMLPSYAGSISSFSEMMEVCVLLRDRVEGVVLCRLDRLDLLARGIVGGIRRVVVTSGTSDTMSNDLVGEIMSLSMDPEFKLEERGGGGRGLFKSVLVGDVGEGLDTVIGTFWEFDGEKDGSKSAKETICGPLGGTAFPCRCFGGGGFALSGLLLSWSSLVPSSSSDIDCS